MDAMASPDCSRSGDSDFPVVDSTDILQEEYVRVTISLKSKKNVWNLLDLFRKMCEIYQIFSEKRVYLRLIFSEKRVTL